MIFVTNFFSPLSFQKVPWCVWRERRHMKVNVINFQVQEWTSSNRSVLFFHNDFNQSIQQIFKTLYYIYFNMNIWYVRIFNNGFIVIFLFLLFLGHGFGRSFSNIWGNQGNEDWSHCNEITQPKHVNYYLFVCFNLFVIVLIVIDLFI